MRILLLLLLAFTATFSTGMAKTPDSPDRERRDRSVDPFLKASIGLYPKNCSATIIYYNSRTKTAYALGCAHCYKELKGKAPTARTYFVGNKREIRDFHTVVIAMDAAHDLCLVSFKPNFEPHWVPVARSTSPFYKPTETRSEQRVIVSGRDAGLPSGDRRPSVYEAFIRKANSDWWMESKQSQSRGGRSGGGVMTEDAKWLIGVVHGSHKENAKHGYWIPLHRIHQFLNKHKYGWLAGVPRYAVHQIPIVDHSGRRLSKESYIPLPGHNDNYKYQEEGKNATYQSRSYSGYRSSSNFRIQMDWKRKQGISRQSSNRFYEEPSQQNGLRWEDRYRRR